MNVHITLWVRTVRDVLTSITTDRGYQLRARRAESARVSHPVSSMSNQSAHDLVVPHNQCHFASFVDILMYCLIKLQIGFEV